MVEYLLARHILNEPHTNLSLPNTPHAIQQKEFSMVEFIVSDVQGFVNAPRVRGKGQKGKGQGKDFLTLNKPLTLVKVWGFSRGFSGVLFL